LISPTGGTKKETQLIMTNMAEGRYTERMNGPRDLEEKKVGEIMFSGIWMYCTESCSVIPFHFCVS
jgi:hypothetical protein